MTINRLNQDVTYLPAFRNLVINGAMQVAQRGTSTTGITGTGYFTADRFANTIITQGTWTNTVENDAPTGSGFRKSIKLLCTTADASPAAGDAVLLQQPIEGQNLQAIRKGTSSAQQLSLSFWVKSNVTGTYVAELQDVDNTRQVSAAYSIASSGTWEKKTIVFPADTTGAFDNDNDRSLNINFWLGSGTDRTSGTLNTSWASSTNANRVVGQTNLAAATNNYWQITGVQLEVGAVATPFEFKPIEQELSECQRYYYRFTPGAAARFFSQGQVTSTTAAFSAMPFPTTMRTRPTAVETTGTAGDYAVSQANSNFQTVTAGPTYRNETTENVGYVIVTVAANLVAGNITGLHSNTGVSTAYLGWSAEL